MSFKFSVYFRKRCRGAKGTDWQSREDSPQCGNWGKTHPVIGIYPWTRKSLRTHELSLLTCWVTCLSRLTPLMTVSSFPQGVTVRKNSELNGLLASSGRWTTGCWHCLSTVWTPTYTLMHRAWTHFDLPSREVKLCSNISEMIKNYCNRRCVGINLVSECY